MQVVRILLLGTFCMLTYGGLNMQAFGQQKQHFRTPPGDQQVTEGRLAVIKCHVGNQAGRVQWAKDGFVLGFNRTIPGYPRYEMQGNGRDGTHHLRIFNTSLHDDADYQCQVGPADGHPPIRATGHLTVLMAPTAVQMVGRGHEEVIEVHEDEEVTLECLVENAKPVADITWYKNDREIRLDTRVDEAVGSSLRKRHNILSKVQLRLTAADDDSTYVCVAEHPALSEPMRAAVKISVLYPPGPPIITGYSAGETIRAGEKRTLTCVSRGGNPLGEVRWYRNNQVIDATYRPGNAYESVNDYTFMVDSQDNAAVYTCEVRNKLTDKPLLASVKFNVQFPPDKVVISGPEHDEKRVGENVTLTCLVENSNPPATIEWVVDGQARKDAITSIEPVGTGGSHTVSHLSMIVPKVERNMLFTCHATNQALGETKVDTYLLKVQRPPQPPVLYGYNEGMGIRVDNLQRISCVSRGGNPPASLQWYRNGQKIPSQKHSIDDVSSADINIKAEPKDNGAQYRCEAHNSAASSPVSVSTTLIVHFPPEEVQISVTPGRLSAGTVATLKCESGASNPPAIITWIRNGHRMPGRLVETTLVPNGGTVVINDLTLNLTAGDDGMTYTCEAKNNPLEKDVKQSVTLRVNYPPQFLTDPPSTVNVEMGDSQILNLTARGNPGPVLYSWTRHGLPLPDPVIDDKYRMEYGLNSGIGGVPGGGHVTADGPLLYISSVTVDDAGDYELAATNQEGTTIAKVYLNVQYPPEIKFSSGVITVSEGEEAQLECAADGNPLTEAMIEWTREGYNFARTHRTFVGKKATLEVLKAHRNDTGIFTCSVNNGIGRIAESNVTLIVRTKPIVEKSQLLNRAAADEGSIGRLQCLAEGAPDVRFSWRRDGDLLTTGARTDKYNNETVKTGLISYSSTFYIRSVTASDYGYYECVAENELGAQTFSVHFTAPTHPDPPFSLKVMNSSHDSVTLVWIPAFDGGKQQYFRLRYRTKASTTQHHLDVYEAGVYLKAVTGLELGTEYYFSIMSYNDIGESPYRGGFVRASTLSQPLLDDRELILNQVLGGSRELPKLIIIVVAIVGTIIVILNIVLVICLIRRKRSKRSDDEGSDQASSKSTTNTMYAPSSYNDTVVGETLSSISEKSRESYTQDDSIVDYEEKTHKHAASTYIIDQIEPPPEYASQTPSNPSSAGYGDPEDDYAEVLRRNAYNHQLGKGTPLPPSRATHYSTSPETRGNLSYSYTPSPTGVVVPNGAAQYHAGGPFVTLGGMPHHEHHYPGGHEQYHGGVYPVEAGLAYPDMLEDHAIHSLELDYEPPPAMGLEQHSIPSEHPSLTIDPHSITIDHPVIAVTDFSNRNGDLRVQPPLNTHPATSLPSTNLTTFNPNPSPSTFSESDMEGHLV